MATTTPNFGWDIPQSTDLVKDGATAIAALGTDIDTALVDLKGGTTGQVLSKNSNTDLDFTWVAQDDSNAIQNALLTTTGDTIYASAASTPARLGLGTAGQVLTVNSGATAPEWATPSSGGMTLLATATPSGATSLSFTSISGSYTHLMLLWYSVFQSASNEYWYVRLNNDSGNNYANDGIYNGNGTLTLLDSGVQSTWGGDSNTSPISITGTTNVFDTNSYGKLMIYNYADTTVRKIGQWTAKSNARYPILLTGIYDSTSAITQINFVRSATQTITGKFYLYGVK